MLHNSDHLAQPKVEGETPQPKTCHTCSTISSGYQDIFLADTFFMYLHLEEKDVRFPEQERKHSLGYALMQIESEKREMNFDRSLPFFPQSKYPRIRSLSTGHAPITFLSSGTEGKSSMGNSDSKISVTRALEQLGKHGQVETEDSDVWNQLCMESLPSIQDIFSILSSEYIRRLRNNNPENLLMLCRKVFTILKNRSVRSTFFTD